MFGKISTPLIFLILSLVSCVDPLEVSIDKEINILVVEGFITTQPGPHMIRLTISAKYGSIFVGWIQPSHSAKVLIRDSDGNIFKCTESPKNSGNYYTDSSLTPKVGKSYTLLITTFDGKEYTSLPEKIVGASEILKLNAVYSTTQISEIKYLSGYEVYATFQDSPDEKNYYMWRNNGILEPRSNPSYIDVELDCNIGNCMIRRSVDRTIRLLKDDFINGNMVTDLAAFIEDDGKRFNDKYLLRIEQHTLTREAYQFFQLLKSQISIDGDLFDPPPATLRGNMINLSNPDENVIGYFRASDVNVDSIYLHR